MFSIDDVICPYQKYGITIVMYYNTFYVLFVFCSSSQNTHNAVKVQIPSQRKIGRFHPFTGHEGP